MLAQNARNFGELCSRNLMMIDAWYYWILDLPLWLLLGNRQALIALIVSNCLLLFLRHEINKHKSIDSAVLFAPRGLLLLLCDPSGYTVSGRQLSR
jgi:hypothetical protein